MPAPPAPVTQVPNGWAPVKPGGGPLPEIGCYNRPERETLKD